MHSYTLSGIIMYNLKNHLIHNSINPTPYDYIIYKIKILNS